MMYWRKLPTNTMRNPYLRRAAASVDPDLRHAVFAFWMELYCIADDFGYADIGRNTAEIARACMMSEDDLLYVADALEAIGLIVEVDPEAPRRKYLLYNWDVPKNAEEYVVVKKSEKLEARRRRVSAIINHEEYEKPEWTEEVYPGDPRYGDAYLDAEARANRRRRPGAAPARKAGARRAAGGENDGGGENNGGGRFFSPQDDKIQKNVTDADRQTRQTRKTQDSRLKTDDTEDPQTDGTSDLRQTDGDDSGQDRLRRDTHTDTHTDAQTDAGGRGNRGFSGENPGFPASPDGMTDGRADEAGGEDAPGGGRRRRKTGEGGEAAAKTPRKKTGGGGTEELVKGGEENAPDRQGAALDMQKFLAAFETASAFFGERNGMGYADKMREAGALRELCMKIASLPCGHSPQVVAARFCAEFEKLVKTNGYFEGMPLIPSNMMKPGAFSRVFMAGQEALAPRKAGRDAWLLEMEKAQEAIAAEREANGGKTDAEKMLEAAGVDLGDPASVRGWLRKGRKAE
jgi:hypothetical protein